MPRVALSVKQREWGLRSFLHLIWIPPLPPTSCVTLGSNAMTDFRSSGHFRSFMDGVACCLVCLSHFPIPLLLIRVPMGALFAHSMWSWWGCQSWNQEEGLPCSLEWVLHCASPCTVGEKHLCQVTPIRVSPGTSKCITVPFMLGLLRREDVFWRSFR